MTRSARTPPAPASPGAAPRASLALDRPAPGRRPAGTIDNIQALRAIAALLVVFVHVDALLQALGIPAFGHGGVDLFFIISGYIMVYTTQARPIGPAAFLLNRITRIAPIYWLITLSVYALALVAPTLLQSTSSDPLELLQSLAFVPFEKSNGKLHPVLFVGWTLNYEMFFYALFALGLLAPRRRLGVLAVTAALAALVAVGPSVPPGDAVASFYTRPIVVEFAAGMALAVFGGRLVFRSRPGRAGLVALALAGLVATAAVPLWRPELSRVVTQGLPALVAVGAAVALHQSGLSLSQRWVIALGNASYSLYLVHPFVTQAVQKVARSIGLSPALAAVLLPVTLALVCLAGVLTHLWVEKPLTGLAKAAADRLLATPAKPPAAEYVRAE